MAKEKILIVDDEENILELLKFNLKNANYEVFTATDGEMALKVAREIKPNLVLLDLMIPVIDGLDVCKKLKIDSDFVNTSIIMVTAKSEELDKILGLELGADDYITKPFSVKELLARVKAVLRRVSTKDVNFEMSYDKGRVVIDFVKRRVWVEGKLVELTLKEFEVLELLSKNKGRILNREVMLDKVWGYEYIGDTRTIDVHVRYLRKKLEEDDKKPRIIETVRGIGYRFNS